MQWNDTEIIINLQYLTHILLRMYFIIVSNHLINKYSADTTIYFPYFLSYQHVRLISSMI